MKKIILTTAIIAGLSVTSAFAQTKVGVYDFWKVWQNDPNVMDMQNQLKDRFAPQGSEIVSLRNTLQNDVIQFKSKSLLDAFSNSALREDIATNVGKLRGVQTNFKQNWTVAQNEALKAILGNIKIAINKVAHMQGINVVLTQANVAYSDDSVDITNYIIQELKNSPKLPSLQTLTDKAIADAKARYEAAQKAAAAQKAVAAQPAATPAPTK